MWEATSAFYSHQSRENSNTCSSVLFPQSQSRVCTQVRGRGGVWGRSSVHTQLGPSSSKHLFHVGLPPPLCVLCRAHAVMDLSALQLMFCIFFLLMAAQIVEEDKTTNPRKEGRKEGERGRSLECFDQRWAGRAAGRVCGPRDAAIGPTKMGALGVMPAWLTQKLWTRHTLRGRWVTDQTRPHTYQDTAGGGGVGGGGGKNNKSTHINSGTSWRLTCTYTCPTPECKQTKLPVTTRSSGSLGWCRQKALCCLGSETQVQPFRQQYND